jgi:hypothetical protein
MAAFNWIEFEEVCPNCNRLSRIRCQTHIASEFAGDENTDFYRREYRLGDKMAWWPPGHLNFRFWREHSEPNQAPDQAVEACCADCQNCKAHLCAVILFDDLRPVQVTHLSLESDWPDGFSA